MTYLVAGVACVVIGTHFLFSQLSVYEIRMLKKEVVFLKVNKAILHLTFPIKNSATIVASDSLYDKFPNIRT
ncbi:hypothetical protein [Bacillus arachidis]|uniref:hypothetical protein n=1 Tax=Bacillus arachidis TaxID=2819290 RepID=UPI001AA04CC2|nr:hypothetical protein [Bacillus arachidis]